AAAGWTKCLGPRVCETGRVYLLRDRAQVGTHSHPGRVLLRVRGGTFWFFAVGAPPPVRTAHAAGTDWRLGQAPFAPGAGAPTGSLAGFGFVVGAPPRCEPRTKRAQISVPGRSPFAPGAGAPTVRGRFWFCCMTIHFRRVSYMWRVLAEHADIITGTHLAQFFADDPQRFGRLHSECGPLLFDYSKQRLTAETLERLFDLARQQQLPEWIDRLFCGEPVNSTEGRAAMHWALRLPEGASCVVDGQDVAAQVHEQLRRMERIVNKVHSGQWRGATGEVVTDVVNIGVGGSDLGPQMMVEALCDSAA